MTRATSRTASKRKIPPRTKRRYPVGAEVAARGVHFRVWAPKRRRVEVILTAGPGAPSTTALKREAGGYFSGSSGKARAGTRYRFQLDGDASFPDPASHFQPDGPHGDSEVVDPRFPWTDRQWRGVRLKGQVLYEMHIGTFTKEGTWSAAAAQLRELSDAGVTTIEVMPVADFPGRFGWGYDGVDLYAPTWLYGTPRDFRAFVDQAHGCGIGVILDVVYNHLGPDGNYLREFSDAYFNSSITTDWGEAINFDGPDCAPVRQFFLSNAAYWIRDFHLDGLRLDATQCIFDKSDPHILRQIGETVRTAAHPRGTIVIGENEEQNSRLIRPVEEGGCGLDALWNDDFHHSAMVALTGRNEAYYGDHLGSAQEFVSAAKHGFLFQGQWYSWQKQPRGSPSLDLAPYQFVNFIQNHDQVANSATGARIDRLSNPGSCRAMTALLLLMPSTPMLFQGEEFAASAPFRYFCDHKPEISKLVLKGRADFLSQFRSLESPEAQAILPDPGRPSTFEACKLDFHERERHAATYSLHKDLLKLRRQDPVLAKQEKSALDGAVLGPGAFLLRFFDTREGDRLLIANLETDLDLSPAPEPLLAPPAGAKWEMILNTDDQKYGGFGAYSPEILQETKTASAGWRVPGRAAVVLAAVFDPPAGKTE